MGQVEELIGSSISDDIGVYVDDLAKLGLFPEVDLGESRVQVPSVHEIKVGRRLVPNPVDRDDIVENGLLEGYNQSTLGRVGQKVREVILP